MPPLRCSAKTPLHRALGATSPIYLWHGISLRHRISAGQAGDLYQYRAELGKIFVEGDIDWRHVSWGGVSIDDRAYDRHSLQLHSAADNPKVSSAQDATWLKDDDIVFGIGINGAYRAYPRRIIEVREMVNDTLGGRDLGIP